MCFPPHGSSSRQWYLSDADWEDAGRRCYEPLAAGQVFQGEMVLRRKDGSPLHCEVRSNAIDASDLSQGSIWITMDITARKEAERIVKNAQAEVAQQVEQAKEALRAQVASLAVAGAERILARHIDEVGNQIVAALQLNVDLGEGVLEAVLQGDETVE